MEGLLGWGFAIDFLRASRGFAELAVASQEGYHVRVSVLLLLGERALGIGQIAADGIQASFLMRNRCPCLPQISLDARLLLDERLRDHGEAAFSTTYKKESPVFRDHEG